MNLHNLTDAARKRLRATALERVLPALRGQTVVHQGNPYDEITSAARRLKVELIVISTHGYTGLKKMFIGSTTGRVVRHAHCPVFVVRAFGRNQRKQQTD